MSVCKLCPRQCGVDRESRLGFCGVGSDPVVARAGLHFWEEPCISGSNGSGTVFFSGCNLRCVFCQNYDISTGVAGKRITVARLKEIYRELIAKGAHNINLVTPTHFADAIAESLSEKLPVPVVYNTNGYESLDTLQKLSGKIQIYLPDLKYSDDAAAWKYSHCKNYFATATAAIREMFRQTGKYILDPETGVLQRGVVIRHLVMPGMLTNTCRVIDFVRENFAPGEVLFSLMRQYVPCGDAASFPEIDRKLTDEEYDAAEEYLFNSGIEDGFVQEKESAGREFIPAFDLTGV